MSQVAARRPGGDAILFVLLAFSQFPSETVNSPPPSVVES
jgi:hypothetical protein